MRLRSYCTFNRIITIFFQTCFYVMICVLEYVLFGFYLAYSSIKRTVWTGFVMILLNVLYNLILICKQLNVQVSIKRTGSVWNTISTGFFYKCVDFEYLKPFNHNRLEPLYLIWVKNVLENRLSRGYWELSLGSFY